MIAEKCNVARLQGAASCVAVALQRGNWQSQDGATRGHHQITIESSVMMLRN